MVRRVKLNELGALCADLSYPVDRDAAVERFDDVVLVYADGEEPLPDVLSRIATERFESPDDLTTAVMNVLPVEAVGEPGQSEGEG
ncbi:MAG: hypothetical protein ABEJ89_02835 [Haloarculaceae archaeon]